MHTHPKYECCRDEAYTVSADISGLASLIQGLGGLGLDSSLKLCDGGICFERLGYRSRTLVSDDFHLETEHETMTGTESI